MLNVVDAVTTARVCPCDCFATLAPAERLKGIRAVYTLDDALRGWGFTPIYDVHGDRLWKEAQQRNDETYRGVAVRFGECIYRRLLGSLVHECIHATCGDYDQGQLRHPLRVALRGPRRHPREGRGVLPRLLQLRRGARLARRVDRRASHVRSRLGSPHRARHRHLLLRGRQRARPCDRRLSPGGAHRSPAPPRPATTPRAASSRSARAPGSTSRQISTASSSASRRPRRSG